MASLPVYYIIQPSPGFEWCIPRLLQNPLRLEPDDHKDSRSQKASPVGIGRHGKVPEPPSVGYPPDGRLRNISRSRLSNEEVNRDCASHLVAQVFVAQTSRLPRKVLVAQTLCLTYQAFIAQTYHLPRQV